MPDEEDSTTHVWLGQTRPDVGGSGRREHAQRQREPGRQGRTLAEQACQSHHRQKAAQRDHQDAWPFTAATNAPCQKK